MKKIILPGLLVGIINLVLGMGVSYIFMMIPQVSADYYSNLMRSYQDPLMNLFFVYPFVQGIIFAWAYDKIKSVFPGSATQKGLNFGFFVWLLATVPGMLITYSSFPFSGWTVLSWLVSGLVCSLAAGLVFAKTNK